MEDLERLTFKRGKFILEEASTPKLRLQLSKNDYWKSLANDGFETDSLRAAAKLRRYADEKLKKLFKRTFQEYRDVTRPPLDHLDDHQIRGVDWILSRKRSYLAHAPGAGKTATVITASLLTNAHRVLFIVPPSLTANWENEIWKFTEPLDVFPTIGIVPTSDRQEEMAWRADFIICPDSMLAKPWVYTKLQEIPFRFIAVDEASRFKDPLAERSLAFYGGKSGETAYPGLFQKAHHVVLMDGSPMPNRPMELWAPTYAMDPEAIDCMDQNDFGYRYCGARPNHMGVWEFLHSSKEAELKSNLQKTFMHVVTESELSHPERRRSLLFLNHDVRSPEHQEWERQNLIGLPESFSEEMSRGDAARFRKELGVRKIPRIASYVKERLREKNDQILVFAWHREVCEQLAERLEKHKVGLIMGGVPNDTRNHLIDLFQKKILRVLVLNIAAGGRGYNLQGADRVIFGEFSWTDELNRQCEKRASRKGSEKSFVRCEYMVSPGSMDEVVLNSVFSKEKRVKKVIG